MTPLLAALLMLTQAPTTGTPVLADDALMSTPVGGLSNTDASSTLVDVAGQSFAKAVRVKIGKSSDETNATQLTLATSAPVHAGDTMVATFWVRGRAAGGGPAHIEFLFEKATDPWTKSVIQDEDAGSEWRSFDVPFSAAESYSPGQAMASFRLAFGPQMIDLGGVQVRDFGTTVSLEDMVDRVLTAQGTHKVSIALDAAHPLQTMVGLGGDFCQARYGETEAMDAVGDYILSHLKVAHARVGLPLNYWEPKEGEFHDDAQAAASFGALQRLNALHIPLVVSVWEGPGWLLGGSPEQSGRVLPPARYPACIEAIARYLTVARDKYGVGVDYITFNEPDYGVNFKFTPDTMRDFIRQAGPRFAALGLKTKFLVGDTGGGAEFPAYARPILADPTIAPYLGPISFHCWDVLSASDAQYAAIGALGKEFGKPVWCLEAGHDAGLWQKPNPWGTWDNAIRTAEAYVKTLRTSDAAVMDYWTYEDNYPLVDKATLKPYPAFDIVRDLTAMFGPGSQVLPAAVSGWNAGIETLGTQGPLGRSAVIADAGGPATITLSGFEPGASLKLTIRDRKAITERHETADRNGSVSLSMPLRSVATVAPAA